MFYGHIIYPVHLLPFHWPFDRVLIQPNLLDPLRAVTPSVPCQGTAVSNSSYTCDLFDGKMAPFFAGQGQYLDDFDPSQVD